MDNHFLTNKYLIRGLFFSFIQKLFPRKVYLNNDFLSDKYTLVEYVTVNKIKQDNRIGVYKKNTTGETFVIKKISYMFKSLYYEHFVNEINILKLVNTIYPNQTKHHLVTFPKLYEVVEKQKNAYMVLEFVTGKTLSHFSGTQKVKSLIFCLEELKKLTNMIDKKMYTLLPKRSSLIFFFLYPMYVMQSLKRSPNRLVTYTKLSILFYKCFFRSNMFHTSYELAHRDLHSKNILLNEKRIYILDPEMLSLMPKFTDLAIVARLYLKELGIENIQTLLHNFLITQEEVDAFLCLTILYTMQSLALEPVNSSDYEEAKVYAYSLLTQVIPSSRQKVTKNIIETIYSFGLSSIALLNTFLPSDSKKPMILCYHAVDNSGWRFSVKPSDFEKHIKDLSMNKKIVPLSAIIADKFSDLKDTVSITFDDGYENIYLNAYPILKKYNLTATLFMIGDSHEANRDELGNQLNLLSDHQVQELQNAGWEIGFHTSTHSYLREMSDDQLENEIVQGKRMFDKKLKVDSKYFAYPRGIYSENIISKVKEAGFIAAFTVDGGVVKKRGNLFVLPRVSLDSDISLRKFRALVSPLGLLFQEKLMTLLKIKDFLQYSIRLEIS